MKTKLAVLATAAVTTLGALFWFGVYDISATEQHLAPTYWLLDQGMRRAVIQRAKRIQVPPLDDAAKIARGAGRYRSAVRAMPRRTGSGAGGVRARFAACSGEPRPHRPDMASRGAVLDDQPGHQDDRHAGVDVSHRRRRDLGDRCVPARDANARPRRVSTDGGKHRGDTATERAIAQRPELHAHRTRNAARRRSISTRA